MLAHLTWLLVFGRLCRTCWSTLKQHQYLANATYKLNQKNALLTLTLNQHRNSTNTIYKLYQNGQNFANVTFDFG